MSGAAPAYHLRPNKGVERLLFVELLRRLEKSLPRPVSDYIYVGMGGPYLEDFHLMHASFGNRKMISLEIARHVLTRQKLNMPHTCVDLTLDSTADFAEGYRTGRRPLLIWFDYTQLEWKAQYSECCTLIGKLPPMSIFKVTFACSTAKLGGGREQDPLAIKATRLSEMFPGLGPFATEDLSRNMFPATMYRIFRKIIAESVPDTKHRVVRSLAGFHYDDGTPILTITLIVGKPKPLDKLVANRSLKNWPYADLDWAGPPRRIDIPHLSLRERLAIDQLLPSAKGRTILRKLKLRLVPKDEDAEKILDGYVEFYRHIPQFLRMAV